MQLTEHITKNFTFINRYRRWPLAALMLMILMLGWAASAEAYSYKKRITINHNQVGQSCTQLQDFAVLIDIHDDDDLKTVANGGHVFSTNGYDIIFKDESGSTKLDHEALRYNGSSGSLVAFVRIPQLSSLSDTIIYLHYGNASVSSSQENADGVWDDDYEAVLHLQESGNGSDAEFKDSSGNEHHGTGGGLMGSGNNSYTPSRTNGLFGYAQNFDGSNDRIRLDAVADSTWSAVTVQAWINPDDNGDDRILGKCYGTGSGDQTWLLRQTGYKIGTRMHTNTANNGGFDVGGLSSGRWFLASVTWDASDNRLRVYLNGNQLNSTTLNGATLYTSPPVSQPTIGNIPGGGRDYNGQLQEARVSKVARSACWFKTEFNNQSSPNTFYSVGPEEGLTTLHTINAEAGSGGFIDPLGPRYVDAGGDITFYITAADGFEIDYVEVDGTSEGAKSSRPFVNVQKDWTIKAYFKPISGGGGDPPPEPLPVTGCGAIDVAGSYEDGFTAEGLTMINTEIEDGKVVLKTGFAAIDKENIVIPFEQEVFVNALYIAGRNDLGYSLLEDTVDGDGNFIGFENIPINKRHGLFRGTWDDAYSAGDGVFDPEYAYGGFPSGNEAGIAAYDDGTGRPFLVNGDGVASPRDMRKSLGTFAAGTEIVIWSVQVDRADMHYDSSNFGQDDSLDHVFFNKHEWNPDFYQSCTPGGMPVFDKIYRLDQPGIEGLCMVDGGWLQPGATDRLLAEFNLEMADAVYTMPITVGDKYHHFIVGAPANEPNQWLLGIEQNNNQHIPSSDIDCNDVVFKLERETGGMVELQADHAITTGSADVTFTSVDLKVWDYMPAGDPCAGQTNIKYELSIDNGDNWVEITDWDAIYQSNENKEIIGDPIGSVNWAPGSPAYTCRTIHKDFSSEGLTGNEIRWRATLLSQNVQCEPKILDLSISASTRAGAEVSRAGPVAKVNLLYSGSYEISDGSWDENVLRGHLRATRIYAPENPNETNVQALWDAGEVLNGMDPDQRKIYVPEIAVITVSEQVGLGLGPGTEDDDNKTFSGQLSHHPILASSVTITDAQESFTDEHVNDLKGNLGGSGKIDRFSGEFSVTFNTAPAVDVPIMAHYQYYIAVTNSALKEFKSSYVTAEMLGIDDTEIIPTGPIYDFDGDGNFETDDDRNWLIDWVRGSEDGTGNQKDWLLGAIDHSVQAVQTPPNLPDWYYGTATTKDERESFKAFVDDQKERDTVIYCGARDGMLHAFDGGRFRWGDNPETNDSDSDTQWDVEKRGYFLWEGSPPEPNYGTGAELWAFIPANLIPRLKNNVLQGNDQAFVDASPALADIYADGAWKTVLLSAQGNGGDTIFALDVTIPDSPKFMWEYAHPELFRSRSSPSIGKIGRILVEGQARWVAFFVSGKTYDFNLYPSIYMINVADGTLVERVILDDEPSGNGGVPSGQPSIVDSDGNGYIDRLYIGTDKGYLYKVNIPDDPDARKYEISNCVINTDFTESLGSQGEVPLDYRYHPIYGSPVINVHNGVDSDGSITYDIKVMYGTGDSPYFDEDIDMGNTRYHFFVYSDHGKKGECNSSDVYLDWFHVLPENHRIFASAFAAAGQVYFGTATTETEDPCDSPVKNPDSPLGGDLYAFDIATGVKKWQKSVGNTTITPIVVDKHLYFKSQGSAQVQSYGEGKYNTEIIQKGFPIVDIRAWHEIY